MNPKYKHILTIDDCPSVDIFQKYLHDELNREQKHAFESHLNDCAFCNDALEGMQIIGNKNFITTLNQVNKNIDKRVQQPFKISTLIAAASFLMVLFLGGIFILRQTSSNKDQLSVKQKDLDQINKDKLAPKQHEKEEITEETIKLSEDVEVVEREEEIIQTPVEKELVKDAQINDRQEKPENNDKTVSFNEPFEEEVLEKNSDAYDYLTNVGGNTLSPPTSTKTYVYNELDEPSIDFDKLITLAQVDIRSDKIETLSTRKTSKKEKKNNVETTLADNTNEIEISFINTKITEIKNGEYQNAVTSINQKLTENYVSENEKLTLKWLKMICLLQLNTSAKDILTELKSTESIYKKEAENLYNQLY